MKYVTQFFYYLFEVCLTATLFFSAFNFINDNNFFSWFQRITTGDFMGQFTVFLVIYQLSVYAILTLRDSAKRDAILSTMKIVNLAILRVEHDKPFNELEILHEKHYSNKSALFLDDKDKEDFKEIRDNFIAYIEGHIDKNDCLFYMRNKLVYLQHGYEYLGLGWRLSFLLRFVK